MRSRNTRISATGCICRCNPAATACLKLMKRGHTIENYFEKIDRIKRSWRDIALTTDIIVGFPGETEADFRDTVKMVEYCGFDSGVYLQIFAASRNAGFRNGR